MTPFGKLARGLLERLAGTFYEGPTPPARLGEMVVAFANENPNATRRQWIEVATEHARECYRSGFVRGAEWAERDFKSRMPSVRPEELADALDHDWRWRPGITLVGDHGAVVRGEAEENENGRAND